MDREGGKAEGGQGGETVHGNRRKATSEATRWRESLRNRKSDFRSDGETLGPSDWVIEPGGLRRC